MSQKPYRTITIIGCGAVGTLLADGFIRAGCEVSVIERHQRYESIRDGGLIVEDCNGSSRRSKPVRVINHFDLPPQDLVVLAVKAHQIEPIAKDVACLLSPETVLLTVQNGLPWWYFEGVESPHQGYALKSVDPAGVIRQSISSANVVGCIAYPAVTLDQSGAAQHIEGHRFPVGELNNEVTPRLIALSHLLQDAGFKAPTLQDLRGEIWLKFWGAAAFNPLSMLTHATMSEIATNRLTRPLVISIMREAESVARQLGVHMRVPLEKRLAGAQAVGAHKTSSLQDLEKGERGELNALLGSLIELGELTGVGTPTASTIYACCALLEEQVLKKA